MWIVCSLIFGIRKECEIKLYSRSIFTMTQFNWNKTTKRVRKYDWWSGRLCLILTPFPSLMFIFDGKHYQFANGCKVFWNRSDFHSPFNRLHYSWKLSTNLFYDLTQQFTITMVYNTLDWYANTGFSTKVVPRFASFIRDKLISLKRLFLTTKLDRF